MSEKKGGGGGFDFLRWLSKPKKTSGPPSKPKKPKPPKKPKK